MRSIPLPAHLAALVLAAGLLAGGALSHDAAAATPAPASIAIMDFAFEPATVTVPAGTTVTWTNHDEDPHSVVASAGAFRSGALDTDGRFSFTFDKPGAYAYFCSLHPHMMGTIVVTAP